MLGASPGAGWSLLAYPDAIGRRWGWLLNAAWLACLCVPIGFWATGRLAFVAAAALALCLLLTPGIAGTAAASGPEWIGAALGFLLGKSLAVLCVRQGGRRNYWVRARYAERLGDEPG